MSKMVSTREIIREITSFLNGTGRAYDWDDFTSIPISDEDLNAIRIECAELPHRYPPGNCRQYCSDEGLRRLEEILNNLKTKGDESR
jgi:hypothetical protein